MKSGSIFSNFLISDDIDAALKEASDRTKVAEAEQEKKTAADEAVRTLTATNFYCHLLMCTRLPRSSRLNKKPPLPPPPLLPKKTTRRTRMTCKSSCVFLAEENTQFFVQQNSLKRKVCDHSGLLQIVLL